MQLESVACHLIGYFGPNIFVEQLGFASKKIRKTALDSNHRQAISKIAAVILISIIIIIAAAGGVYYVLVAAGQTDTPLILYSADAYVSETAAFASGFTNQTGIQTTPPKGGGSSTLAQQIAQGNPVSVFVSVSKSAVSPSYLKNTSSGWAIAIGADQMTIAYSNATKQNKAGEKVIAAFQTATATNTTKDWANFYSNLTSGTVKVGISNPNADPAGYRGWLVLEDAGYTYKQNESYFSDLMLVNSGNITGASAADLIAPLQSGQIQFLFIYRSTAAGQQLNYLQLPSAVNLGNASYSNYYSQFTYKTAGGVEAAGPIVLFVTVPTDSTDPTGSLKFMTYVIQHTSILSGFGMTPFSPSILYNNTVVPQEIQKLVSQGDLILGGSL